MEIVVSVQNPNAPVYNAAQGVGEIGKSLKNAGKKRSDLDLDQKLILAW